MTRVVLTQPIPRVRGLAARIRLHGHQALELPVRRLRPLPAGAGWAVELPARYDWVIFVSPGAIEIALAGFAGAWPESVGIAVVGPGSASELARHSCIGAGVRIVQPGVAPHDAEALLQTPPFDVPRGLRVLVLRGVSGREDWLARLRGRGAQVEVRALYETVREPVAPQALACLVQWAAEDVPVVIAVTSVDTVDSLERLLAGRDLLRWARTRTVLTQHPRIAQALRERGWSGVRSVAPGDDGMLAGIESEGGAAEDV